MTPQKKTANRVPLKTRLDFAEYLFRDGNQGLFLRSKLEEMVHSAYKGEIPQFSVKDVLETRKSYHIEVGCAESELSFLACSIADLLTHKDQKYIHRVRSAGFSPSRNKRQEVHKILTENEFDKIIRKNSQFIPTYQPVSLHDSSESLEIIHDIFYVLPIPKSDNIPIIPNEADVYQISYRMKKLGIKSTVKILGLEKKYPRNIPEHLVGRILDGWGIRVFINDGFGETESQNKCYDARLRVAEMFRGDLEETRFGKTTNYSFSGDLGIIIDEKDYFHKSLTGFNALYLTVQARTGQACEIQFLTKTMYNRNEDSQETNKREYKGDKYAQYFRAMDNREKEIFYHVMKSNFIMFDSRIRKSPTEIFYNFENEVKFIRRIIEERRLSNVPNIWLPNQRIIY